MAKEIRIPLSWATIQVAAPGLTIEFAKKLDALATQWAMRDARTHAARKDEMWLEIHSLLDEAVKGLALTKFEKVAVIEIMWNHGDKMGTNPVSKAI